MGHDFKSLSDEAPIEEENWPGGTGKQPAIDETPVVGLYVPAPHAVHSTLPGVAL